MDSSAVALLTDRFASLQDPRTGRAKRHEFIDVIVIAICAVICGSDSWVDVEIFGKSKKAWLSGLLNLPNGIPSHAPSVGSSQCWTPFSSSPASWSGSRRSTRVMEGQVVAIDGKTYPPFTRQTGGQVSDPHGECVGIGQSLGSRSVRVDEHSKEITAIPELLSALDVSGCTVTIDAIGCQKEIAATITDPWGRLCSGAQAKPAPTLR